MCGIAGFVAAPGHSAAGHSPAPMAQMLRHRGPDGAAYRADDGALLVHTRLGIIDLETGTQPLHNENKSVWLICNGEIFNYIELREALKQRGHQFATGSDSEVIIHLYEEFGLDFLDHLNGQFAFCLWDTVSETAVLARDRVGIAPLYWSEKPDGLWFASEAKAILAGCGETPRLDPDAFQQLLNFWAPVSPQSVFAGIREVMPGEMLIYRRGRLNARRYWDLDFPRKNDFEAIGEERAAAEIRQLLTDSTRLRLRADVPVGAYLSGGLDSSIIASLIRQHSQSPLQTYSLTFGDVDLDESRHQQTMAARLGTEHFSVACRPEDIVRDFEAAVWHSETPLVRTAPVPMGLLSGLVGQQGRRVVLTGEGADEVFGGYDIFKESKLRQFWARQPQSRWRPILLRRLYPYLDLPKQKAGQYLAGFFGAGLDEPDHPLFSHRTRMDTGSRVNQFLSPEWLGQLRSAPQPVLLTSLPEAFDDWLPFCKAQYLEMKTLMPGYLLSTQGDRMLMRHSVEGRFPFLDHNLIDYANRLHPRLKMRVLREKYILKKAMEKELPASILQRYKQPYRAPMNSIFGGELPDYARYLLSPEKIRDYGYFDHRKVDLLLKKARSGRISAYKDNMALVLILSTQCWHQQFVEDFSQRFAPQPRPDLPALQRVA